MFHLPPITMMRDLSELMESMRSAALQIIDQSRGPFDLSALQIFRVMRPRFGPANGWLFNERAALLDQLADRLGLDPADAISCIDEAQFEGVVEHLEQLEAVCNALSLESRVRQACRSELLWSPAPGFALTIIDPSQRSDWKPTYAGTPAGPDQQAVQVGHSVTLYVYPPLPGQASQELVAREQPGSPVFSSGQLIAFTLQEPQSGDVHPETVLAKILEELPRGGLIFHPPDDVTSRLGERVSNVGESYGILTASANHPPPDDLPDLGGWTALWWLEDRGEAREYYLLLV